MALALGAACAKGTTLESSGGGVGAAAGSGAGGSIASTSTSSGDTTSSASSSSSSASSSGSSTTSSSTSASSTSSSTSTSSTSSSTSTSSTSSSTSASSSTSSSSTGGPVCGDGTIEGTEACDGADLGGKTCKAVVGKPATGTLACTSSCTFDTSGCHWCGDGYLDPGEECDDANATNGDGCENCVVVCVYGYKWTNNHCYAESTAALPWDQANAECQGVGGHLASVTSAQEGDFIWNNVMDGANSTNARWLGGTDQAMEGTWVWTTGEPFTYTNWNAGEPNNSGGAENCLEYYYNINAWNDDSCSATRIHVCEWEPPVAHP